MAITRPAISTLKSGDLDRSGIATLKAQIEALNGLSRSLLPNVRHRDET